METLGEVEAMILYSENSSPYCAPVRMAAYAKSLDLTIAAPPGGLGSDEYRDLSRTGTIPCLILDDGTALPESAVIITYLDDKFSKHPLHPSSPEQQARMRLIARLAENEILAPLVALFHAMNDEAVRSTAVRKVAAGLAKVEPLVSDRGFALGRFFTQADCMLGIGLYATRILPNLIGRDVAATMTLSMSAYLDRLSEHPPAKRVLDELQEALARSATRS